MVAITNKQVELPLLKETGTVTIPAPEEPFVVRQKFVVGTAQVNIFYLGNNFQEWFLNKIEKPVGEVTLRYAQLVESSASESILGELRDKAKTELAYVYALMKSQPRCEQGILLTDERTNIFYVPDVNGTLRSVYLNCFGHGWSVGAEPIEFSAKWKYGDQVFFRNS